MSIPPPLGMSEVDYEAIEAAVTETVRGRWFLNEFARRNRVAETRLLLDAMARLEATVASGQAALPSADPSIRLLVQRIKEIAGQLDGVAREMRDDGIDARHWAAVDHQARAVAGLMRSATPVKPAPPPIEARAEIAPAAPRLPRADLPPALRPQPPAPVTAAALQGSTPQDSAPEDRPPEHRPAASPDPRRTALSGLDRLTLSEKLALFA